MTEINFRMAELEKESVKKRSKRRVCNKYFKDIRDLISTYSGMKRVLFSIMLIILIIIPIIRVIKEFLKVVVEVNILKGQTYAFIQPVIDLGVCLIPALLIYLFFIPSLKKMLLKVEFTVHLRGNYIRIINNFYDNFYISISVMHVYQPSIIRWLVFYCLKRGEKDKCNHKISGEVNGV